MKLKIYLFLMFSMVVVSLYGMDFPEDNLIKVKTTDQEKILVDKAVLSQLGFFKDVSELYPSKKNLPLPVTEKELNSLPGYLKGDSSNWENIAQSQKVEDVITALIVADKLAAPKKLQQTLGEMVAQQCEKIDDKEKLKAFLSVAKNIPDTIIEFVTKDIKLPTSLLQKIVQGGEVKNFGNHFTRESYTYKWGERHYIKWYGYTDASKTGLLVNSRSATGPVYYKSFDESGSKVFYYKNFFFSQKNSYLVSFSKDEVSIKSLKQQDIDKRTYCFDFRGDMHLPHWDRDREGQNNIKKVLMSPDEKYIVVFLKPSNRYTFKFKNGHNVLAFFSLEAHDSSWNNHKDALDKALCVLEDFLSFHEEEDILFHPNGDCFVVKSSDHQDSYRPSTIYFLDSKRTKVVGSQNLEDLSRSLRRSLLRRGIAFSRSGEHLVFHKDNDVYIYAVDQQKHSLTLLAQQKFIENPSKSCKDEFIKFSPKNDYFVVTSTPLDGSSVIIISPFSITSKNNLLLPKIVHLDNKELMNKILINDDAQFFYISHYLYQIKRDGSSFGAELIADNVGEDRKFCADGGGYFSVKNDNSKSKTLVFFNNQGEKVSKLFVSDTNSIFPRNNAFLISDNNSPSWKYYSIINSQPYQLLREENSEFGPEFIDNHFFFSGKKDHTKEGSRYSLSGINLKPLQVFNQYQLRPEEIGLLHYLSTAKEEQIDWQFVEEHYGDTLEFFKKHKIDLAKAFYKPESTDNNQKIVNNSNASPLLSIGFTAMVVGFMLGTKLIKK